MASTRNASANLAMKESLQHVRAAANSAEKTLEVLGSQRKGLSAAHQSMKNTETRVEELEQRVKGNAEKIQQELATLQVQVTTESKEKVWSMLKPKVDAVLMEEVKKHVQIEVESQIADYIPIPLKKQREENKVQIDRLSFAIINSNSRMENYRIEETAYDAQFSPLLREDGQASKKWPLNMTALYSYDESDIKKLLEDYGLEAGEGMQANCNAFLAHIGSRLQMLELDTDDEED